MNMVKFKLTIVLFFQFFVWGTWLLTIGAYWFNTKHWPADSFGWVFATMGIASIISTNLFGAIADRYFSLQKIYAFLHVFSALFMACIPLAKTPTQLFGLLLGSMIFYMPTIPLSNTVSYSILHQQNLNVNQHFPKIRVWGTVGFVIALWTVSLSKLELTHWQFIISAISEILLAFIALTLPNCRPQHPNKNWNWNFLLPNFTLLKNSNYRKFFLFSLAIGAALQLTNAYSDTFLHSFAENQLYSKSLIVQYPAIVISLSQLSEILFILTIPWFLKKFGIQKVLLFSILAWFIRFTFLGLGNPGNGSIYIIISCLAYGMAFDFFNISGSMFLESEIDSTNRNTAQALFTFLVNGVGSVLGSAFSGIAIQYFFTSSNGEIVWNQVWFTFGGYILLIAFLFLKGMKKLT